MTYEIWTAMMASPNITFSHINKLEILSRHPFFYDLPSEIRNRIVEHAKLKRYSASEIIFNKGDPGTCLFIVCSGIVKIDVRSRGGKDAVFNLVKEGEFFGEIAVLDGLPRTANARAFTDCELMRLDRRDLIPVMESYPPLMLHLLRILCARLRRTTEQVEDLMFIDLAGRLARTLLGLAAASKTPGRICVTQSEIAQIAGLSREMTNKQLRTWAKDNWIKLARKEIVILQPVLLSKIVSSNETA